MGVCSRLIALPLVAPRSHAKAAVSGIVLKLSGAQWVSRSDSIQQRSGRLTLGARPTLSCSKKMERLPWLPHDRVAKTGRNRHFHSGLQADRGRIRVRRAVLVRAGRIRARSSSHRIAGAVGFIPDQPGTQLRPDARLGPRDRKPGKCSGRNERRTQREAGCHGQISKDKHDLAGAVSADYFGGRESHSASRLTWRANLWLKSAAG